MHIARCLLIFVIFRAVSLQSAEEHGEGGRQENYGEDITRPLNRLDARAEVQRGENCPNSTDVIMTARADFLFELSGEWKVGIRAELPYTCYWSGSGRQSCYTSIDHLDDSFLQVIAVAPPCGKWTAGFGVKAIIPTGGDNLQIGQGKYQLLPSLGVKYGLDQWSKDAYAGLILRHGFSVAGYRSAPYVNQTYIEPFVNIGLPCRWFINFSPEIIYNWPTNRWFVPFDMMVGKKVAENIIVSLEYQGAIVYGYRNFTQSLEFRLGCLY